MDSHLQERAAILQHFGATPAVAEEILVYNSDLFNREFLASVPEFPLPDEMFVPEWQGYARELNAGARFEDLAGRLVQLSFPIQSRMSEHPEYVAVTRRGADASGMSSATGIRLERSRDIRLVIHPTWAGRIPVVTVPCRADFITLVRAFSARNEPVAVPESMGACIIAGYNNWNRLRRFREEWQQTHGSPASLQIAERNKECYQDRFLILSAGPYSGVPAERVGVPASQWPGLSLIIRREHECAHYWTRRVLRSMRNYVIDEIIADYSGILAATGRFRADWLLVFLGLDLYPSLREEGRLRNYRGSPPLGDEAFAIVWKLVVAAAENLELFHQAHERVLQGRKGALLVLLTLSSFALEQLATEQAVQMLSAELERNICKVGDYLRRAAAASSGPIWEDSYAKSASDAGRFGRS